MFHSFYVQGGQEKQGDDEMETNVHMCTALMRGKIRKNKQRREHKVCVGPRLQLPRKPRGCYL